jgi:hypothetical protein
MVTRYPETAALHAKSLEPKPQVFTKPLDYEALTSALANVNREGPNRPMY